MSTSRDSRWIRLLLVAGLAISTLLPLLLLAVASVGREWFFPALLPPTVSFASWRDLLDPAGRLGPAGISSAVIGCGTGLICIVVALPIGRALVELEGWQRRLGAAAAFLPVATPPIALATGLQLSFLHLGIGGTAIGVMLAHAVPAVGYASLYFLGVFAVFDRRIEDEARSLGATSLQTLVRVTIPLLRRPIAEVFLLGFLISWAQVPLTLIVGAGAVRTLPVAVLSYVQAGQDRYAAAGALLLIIPAMLMLAAVGVAARRTEAVAV
jgi:putative spermidine/putrescine transport system permease protein